MELSVMRATMLCGLNQILLKSLDTVLIGMRLMITAKA